MVFGNPLIHIVKMKQMWRMHAASVGMHEDTICDLAEEWQGRYSSEDIARAAGMAHTVEFGYRLTEVRKSRGGPGDPHPAGGSDQRAGE